MEGPRPDKLWLNPDKPPANAIALPPPKRGLTDCVAFGTPQQKAAAAAQLLSGSFLLMLEERTDRLALAKCA